MLCIDMQALFFGKQIVAEDRMSLPLSILYTQITAPVLLGGQEVSVLRVSNYRLCLLLYVPHCLPQNTS